MNLDAKQLNQHLKTSPSHFYVLQGSEAFLLKRSAESLQAYAQSQGYEQRQTFVYEGPGFDWESLLQSLSSPSLFAPKQVIEWVWQSSKFNDSDLKSLGDILPPAQDTLFIIKAGALTKAQLNAKWFKQITQGACIVTHWPPFARELPDFVGQLAKEKNLQLTPQGCQFLAAQYQGRLDRLAQHIEKVALSHQGPVSLEALHEHLDNQQAFDVFALQSAMITQSKQVVTILNHLKVQKVELSLVIWCLGRLLETLILALSKGFVQDKQWARTRGIWANEHQAFTRLCSRLKVEQIERSLASLAKIDKMAKTGQTDLAWQQISFICLNLIGALPHLSQLS